MRTRAVRVARARGAWRVHLRVARALAYAQTREHHTRCPLGDGVTQSSVWHTHRHTAIPQARRTVQAQSPHTLACDSCTPRAQQSEHTFDLKRPIVISNACACTMNVPRRDARACAIGPSRSALCPRGCPIALTACSKNSYWHTQPHRARRLVCRHRCLHPLQPPRHGFSRCPFLHPRMHPGDWG